MNPEEEEIVRILREAKRIAVVGWSADPARPSNGVSNYLRDQGYTVLPVNPKYAGQEAYGTKVVADVTELSDVDIVDVFRRSEFVTQHVDNAIELGAPVFWMQLGVRNEEAAKRLEDAGITVVQDHCTMADHRRFGLGS